MKKILLVDDEILVRESIRENVDWEGEGFLFCGDAPDGELALPLIEAHQPDILITDIKMPFMDGLELSRIVRQKYPHIKIVILSGHDEFEYARSALRLGITEYCLKPVGAAELVGILKSIAVQIDEERRQMDRLAEMESLLAANRDLRCQKLLSDLCTGLISTPEALHLAATLGIDLAAGHYVVAITEVLPPDDDRAGATDEQIREAVRRIEAGLSSAASVLSYPRSRTETVWVLKGESEEALREGLRLLHEKLLPRTESALGCGIIAGTGSLQRRLHGIHASYLAAEEEKTYRKLLRANFRQMERSVRNGESAVWLDRNRFVEFLKIGRREELDAFVSSFAAELKRIDWHTNMYGYFLLNDLTLMALHASRDLIQDAETMERRYREWQQSIQLVRSHEDARDYLKRLAAQILDWREEGADRYVPILEKVKNFIQKNYERYDLSLQLAAEHAGVSPSHLSKIFSQGTGITFIEYLTRTRIRKAMELLLTTRLKSYEVGYRVGYNDAHYFSSLFKKMTGMTTKEFRKRGTLGASAFMDGGREISGHVPASKG
ncbi:MAG: hypothetical protein BAA02_01620 [Paenibacillaceae bacterium ZCTH02-B3]|nr:MAG: hypothetical protein BAA02_01620 [Paenibacillaceae bacterium ZCTH02-B3]